MNDFFEKLKKGMDAEKPIEPEEPPNEQPQADLAVASVVKEEIKPKKKRRTVPKNPAGEGKIKVEKIPLIKKKTISDGFSDIENEDWLNKEKIGQLTVDLYQTDKEIIIQSAIAGVEPEDLDITIEDDLVIIRGKREKKFKEEKRNYFYQECHWGQFFREIILPVEADSSKTVASMEQGILTIRIPKTGTETKKKIEIE
ncbi:MAG: Hsp20/alpha crystallin family protein [bacterium]|nr:Hsp20/alpha crystallin family protein [bacterium]